MYPTADGRAILAAPIERHFWEQFCEVLGLPDDWKSRGDWSHSGMDFGSGDAHADEVGAIADRTRQKSLQELWTAFGQTDIPFAPLLTPAEALASDHAAAEGILRSVPVGDEVARVAATPIRFADDDVAGEPGREMELPPLTPAPGLGEHTEELLGVLGLDLDPSELGSPG